MSKRKSQELKDFLIKARKKHSPKLTVSPIWAIQRSGKRHYNAKQRRHWRETHLRLAHYNLEQQRKKHKTFKRRKKH